jgi:hypothetical protein
MYLDKQNANNVVPITFQIVQVSNRACTVAWESTQLKRAKPHAKSVELASMAMVMATAVSSVLQDGIVQM